MSGFSGLKNRRIAYNVQKRRRSFSDMATKRKERRRLRAEHKRMQTELHAIRRALEQSYIRFDEIRDPMQLDACIYEINALRAKYSCAVHDLRTLPQPQE
jgi:hypothetical protein